MTTKRRTQGIRSADHQPAAGFEVALGTCTPAQIAAARRVVDRTARDEDDRSFLLDVLGLGPATTILAAASTALLLLGRHLKETS